MKQTLYYHRFGNGLVLLAESMGWLESAAVSMSLPAGCIRDPAGLPGLASFASEMVQRGCGELDSRGFVEMLDRLGADRSSAVGHAHASFSLTMLAERLPEVISLLGDLIRRPHLPEEQLEDARDVCLLEIESIEDDPARLAMVHLRRDTYPGDWGRRAMGTSQGIQAISIEDIRSFVKSQYVPSEATIAVAGNFEWERLKANVEEAFGDWTGSVRPAADEPQSQPSYRHIDHDSSQTQISLAYDTVPFRSPEYMKARGAVGVLSDGMSSRLFTTVREERGLCYTIYAYHHSLRNTARVMCYAGTGADRAQETLDVMVNELVRMREGIDERELMRLKARTKSALIMQQESCVARAGSLAADWYYLGRIQTMDEIRDLVDQLTVANMNKFLREHPLTKCNLITLGRRPLEVPRDIS